MRKTIVTTSMLSAWAMALAFDQIEKATGARVDILLGIAVAIMVFGLYKGLYTNNKRESKEEL